MSNLEIRPIRTARERRTFLTFPWYIYCDDPLWVPPLLPERAKTIDPERGTFFKRGGEAEFFIAWRDGQPVGTICDAEDKFTNEQRDRRECVFGFFEYVEDYAVFEALLDRVIEWARQRHLDTLFGPFNLDYEDSYGVLIEGRDRPPALLCGHTPSYYQHFMERFGFQPARGNNLAYAIDVDVSTPAAQRLFRLAERVRRRGNITIRSGDLAALRGIPGVGTKTAERIIVELRDRIGRLEGGDLPTPVGETEEATLSALINLGYPRSQAEKAVRVALERLPDGPALEDLIREVLRAGAR